MSEDSDDKTEDPSSKRLEEAYEKGNVPSSMEVSSFAVLLAAVMVVNYVTINMSQKGLDYGADILRNIHQFKMDPNALRVLFFDAGAVIFDILVLPFAMLISIGLIAHLLQHKVIVSADKIIPKFKNISPMAGFARVFGKPAMMNFAKGIMKMAAVGIAVFLAIWPMRSKIESMVTASVESLLITSKGLIMTSANAALMIIGIIAAVDYFLVRRKWWNGLKMTKQEVKDEYKQAEGNVEMKAKIRQIGQQRIRKQISSAVPKATVIITNPTHYAIALQYEKDMQAPVCLAKGVDFLAFKIREIAEATEIPLVENVALARALYATVEIDEEIPVEHYKAVAEIIGYVYRLRQKAKAWKA